MYMYGVLVVRMFINIEKRHKYVDKSGVIVVNSSMKNNAIKNYYG